MCGIAGSVALREGLPPPELADVEAMLGAIAHRGPDALGAYRDRHAALGHARLSIIDLATGGQPMSNEDGTLWVVFNGEIFNYVELREELVALGHRFRTRSDTEVILHAWEAYGPRRLRAVQRAVRDCALGTGDPDADPRPRPARRAAAAPVRARGPALVRERGEGDLRGLSGHPARARPRGPRRDVHLLDGGAAADALRRRDRARARSRAHDLASRGGGPPVLDRAVRAGGRRRRRARPGRGRRARPRRAPRGGPAQDGPLGRPGGELPLGRARQLDRGGARAARGRASGSSRSPSGSRTRSSTRRRTSARWRRSSGRTTARSWCGGPTSRRRFRAWWPTPSVRCSGPRRRRSSSSPSSSARPGSRSS